ncbi:MAG: glycosyltransferase family 2 protein [Candidatus Gastranaerophilaceae bacterium]
MYQQPLLSICIPTYNRAELLEQTIESIVVEKVFQNTFDVEIVISDNCSSDKTQEICNKYVQEFPNKIIYNRESNNIGADNNFTKVLSLANGKLLKLNNDKCMFLPGALDIILQFIKNNLKEKNILFFSNGVQNFYKEDSCNEEYYICHNINDLLNIASHRITWIGAFSIWKEDFENYKDFQTGISLQLLQTKILLEFLEQNRKIIVSKDNLLRVLPTNNNGGYNPAKIFGVNYLNILIAKYYKNGTLNKKVYEREKYNTLKLINQLYFDYKKRYTYIKDGYFKYLLPIYYSNLYFYIFFVISYLKEILAPIYIPLRNIYTFFWYKLHIFLFQKSNNTERLLYYKNKLDNEIIEQIHLKEV